MCLPRICLGVWLTAAILQLVLTAVVYVRRRLLYTGSLHKSYLWASHVACQITLAIYRALRWSPGHSSEDARSRYIPDTKRQRPFRTFCHSTVRRFSLVDNDVVIAETGRWQKVGLPMRGSGCNTVSYSYSTSNSLCFLFPGLPVPCSCI
jgi:hypothetical protein